MNQRHITLALFALLSLAGCAIPAEGEPRAIVVDSMAESSGDTSQKTAQATAKSIIPRPVPSSAAETPDSQLSTLGGRFFWTDELVYHDWRIQRHADEGHYRLLDGDEKRHASGSFDECLERFESIKQQRKLLPLEGKVVLVLHGLGRTRVSNEDMVEFLRENSKYTVLSMGYASTRAEVAAHARSLARVIEHLGSGVTEINFVAHSLGNIVIRHYLADHTDLHNGRRPDLRIKRIVMVGPPNNGARMAEMFGQNAVFERFVGRSGRAIARQWEDLKKNLAVPQTEFGVIAGGRGNDDGYNPLLPGDDDFVLGIDETKLKGARDFIVIKSMHAVLMSDTDVQTAALRFLEHGYFVSEEKRQPLQ
jgi:pimeloyl-ACP methyl ester carboxylesterase